jgi:hypothetical protein
LHATGTIYGIHHYTNKQGETYLNGTFSGTARFGEQIITASSPVEMFVAKYNSEGIFLNVIHSGNAYNTGFATNNTGEMFIAGSFRGTSDFGNTKLVSYGSRDAFFAKHDAITGVHEPNEKPQNQLAIYANPTTGKCTISIPDEFLFEKQLTLQLYDMQGKLIQNNPVVVVEGKIKLNMEAEAKGVYQVSLGNGVKVYVGKVVFE